MGDHEHNKQATMRVSALSRRAVLLAAACASIDPSLPAEADVQTAALLPVRCSWESWVFPGDVPEAVQELRLLLVHMADAKILKQVDLAFFRVVCPRLSAVH